MLVTGKSDQPGSLEDLIDSELIAKLDRIDLRTARTFPGKLPGERRSKTRGQSVEFEDFRPYVIGDDLRRVDWKIFARLDRLFVKIFLEEEDLAVHLLIDASASMDAGDPNKLVFIRKLAAALGYVGLENRNRVSATVFGGERLARMPESRGRRSLQRLVAFLTEDVRPATAPPGTGADFTSALRAIGPTLRGAGVVVLLSDLLIPDGFEHGLRHVAAARGYDVWCLQTLSPGEIDPSSERAGAGAPALAGDLRLVDVETGRAAEVTVTSALIKRYRERLEQHCDAISSYCSARQMHHLVVRTDTPITEVVFGALRRQGMLV